MLSECNNVFESIEGSLSKRMVAIKKYQALLAMIQNDKRASEVVIDVLRHLGICYLNIGNYAAAGANFASAWSLCSTSTQKDLKKDIAYQIAQCKEEDGDLEGALDWYKLVCDSFGMFSTCLEGVRRIERKMGKNSGIFPRQPKINTRKEESLVNEFQDMLPTNEKRSIAETMKRCDHCSRGGIKLLLCKGCANDQEAPSTNYCSKECQKSHWKNVHKYTCACSKARLITGQKVKVHSLDKSPQYNGKDGKIVTYMKEKGRFKVEIENKFLALKPQNLKKIV